MRKKLILISITLGLLSLQMHAQTRYRLRGKVLDERTQKAVKRMPFKVLTYNRIVETDNKGEFIFEMPSGKQEFVIDYEPFDKLHLVINLQQDTTIVIQLTSPFASQYIEEVEIVSAVSVSDQPASIDRVDAHTLERLPVMLGEKDVLKAFALTAGVTSGSEGSSEIQVRGGTHGQNLFLLDGVPLYSTQHAFGFVSAYNPIIVKSARLYKSSFPSEFGGKLSSVVNVTTKEADVNKKSGEAEIGLLASKLSLNIPVVKDKLGLQVSGRLANYALANFAGIFFDPAETQLKLHFADLNSNLLWKVDDKNKLRLNFFHNSDGIDVGQSDINLFNSFWIKNSQNNLGLHWFSEPNGKLSQQMMVYADRYMFDFGVSSKNTNESYSSMNQILSGITTLGLDEKLQYRIDKQHSLQAGLFLKNSTFSPIQSVYSDTTTQRSMLQKQAVGNEFGGYAEWHGAFAENKHQFTAGIRTTVAGSSGTYYMMPEPRFGYHGMLSKDFSLTASVSRMTQPIHRIANSGLGIAFEVFAPSDARLRPESSWQYSLGIGKDLQWKKMKIGLKADAWYKSFKDITEFKDGYDARSVIFQQTTSSVYDIVSQGKGKAFGIDFSADITHAKWSLTADYTLMKAVNQFEDLNEGNPFPASTDIRNSLSLTGSLKLSDRWSLNATWQYQTGRPITIPTSMIYPQVDIYTGTEGGYYTNFTPVYTERNNFRMKNFHKLDLSVQYKYQTRKKHEACFTLGVYNAYNRANSYLYYIGLTEDAVKYDIETGTWEFNKDAMPVLKSMSLFPVLPSFSWNIKF